MHSEALLKSLEIVVEKAGDPAPQIYARLFAQNPQLEEMFVLDRDGAVRAEMIRLCFDAIVDLGEGGHYARGLISTELINHGNNGVSPDQFMSFFTAIRDCVRDIAATQWTPAMEAAWQDVMTAVSGMVAAELRRGQ